MNGVVNAEDDFGADAEFLIYQSCDTQRWLFSGKVLAYARRADVQHIGETCLIDVQFIHTYIVEQLIFLYSS